MLQLPQFSQFFVPDLGRSQGNLGEKNRRISWKLYAPWRSIRRKPRSGALTLRPRQHGKFLLLGDKNIVTSRNEHEVCTASRTLLMFVWYMIETLESIAKDHEMGPISGGILWHCTHWRNCSSAAFPGFCQESLWRLPGAALRSTCFSTAMWCSLT